MRLSVLIGQEGKPDIKCGRANWNEDVIGWDIHKNENHGALGVMERKNHR
jgi:hypothetical protein